MRNVHRRRILRDQFDGRHRQKCVRHAGKPPCSRHIGHIYAPKTPVRASSHDFPDYGTNDSATDSLSEKRSSVSLGRHGLQNV